MVSNSHCTEGVGNWVQWLEDDQNRITRLRQRAMSNFKMFPQDTGMYRRVSQTLFHRLRLALAGLRYKADYGIDNIDCIENGDYAAEESDDDDPSIALRFCRSWGMGFEACSTETAEATDRPLTERSLPLTPNVYSQYDKSNLLSTYVLLALDASYILTYCDMFAVRAAAKYIDSHVVARNITTSRLQSHKAFYVGSILPDKMLFLKYNASKIQRLFLRRVLLRSAQVALLGGFA